MKLMTKEIEKKLIKMGSQEDSNPRIIVKFFCPWNQWTWYVLEGEKLLNGNWRFYGLVDGIEKELGYFTLGELKSIKKCGIGIERDKWFGFERRLNEFQEQIKKEIKGKKKNPYLNPNGGFDLIEKFPVYQKK